MSAPRPPGERASSRSAGWRRPGRGALRVLAYHRVAEPESTPELEPALVSATPQDFRRQMEHLARRYRVVSMEEARTAFREGHPLPRRAVLLTFDDAYRDFGEHAWPILKELGLPAALFVPTAYPGRPERAFWWDRLHRLLGGPAPGQEARALPGSGIPELLPLEGGSAPEISRVRALMKGLAHEEVERMVDQLGGVWSLRAPPDRPAVLDWDELRDLAREGVTLGAHTRWHPPLTWAGERQVRDELRGSLEDLWTEVGSTPAVVTYPYGFHDDRVVRIAREEGFELGFTCLSGLNRVGKADPLRLCRTNVTRNTTPLLFRIRMRPWFAAVDRWRHRAENSVSAEASGSVESLRKALGTFSTPHGGPP